MKINKSLCYYLKDYLGTEIYFMHRGFITKGVIKEIYDHRENDISGFKIDNEINVSFNSEIFFTLDEILSYLSNNIKSAEWHKQDSYIDD